jgi:hypothetical protein
VPRLVSEPHTVILEDVRFRVLPSGVLRMGAELVYGVPAFARGWLRPDSQSAEVHASRARYFFATTRS